MQSSHCKLADLTTKDQNQNKIGNPSQIDKIDFLHLTRAWMHFAPFLVSRDIRDFFWNKLE